MAVGLRLPWEVANLRSEHQPVLGTVLTIHLRGWRGSRLLRAEATLLEAIDRFESIFSAFRVDSELARWRVGGEVQKVSDDLGHLLRLALDWQHRSNGIFNPAAGLLSARWARAEADQVLPSAEELLTLAGEIVEPRYTIDGRTVTKLKGCSSLNFNAIAKGTSSTSRPTS